MSDLNFGGLDDSQKRLFAVRCARRVQHLMQDPRSIAALDVAERYALGQATNEELAAARDAARVAAWVAASDNVAARVAAWVAASDVARTAYAAQSASAAVGDAASAAEREVQAKMLEEIKEVTR